MQITPHTHMHFQLYPLLHSLILTLALAYYSFHISYIHLFRSNCIFHRILSSVNTIKQSLHSTNTSILPDQSSLSFSNLEIPTQVSNIFFVSSVTDLQLKYILLQFCSLFYNLLSLSFSSIWFFHVPFQYWFHLWVIKLKLQKKKKTVISHKIDQSENRNYFDTVSGKTKMIPTT
jgi:hypothetical protein